MYKRQDYYGNRSIVAVLEPSEVFGEAFVCAGIKSIPVDVVALGKRSNNRSFLSVYVRVISMMEVVTGQKNM